MKNLKIVSIFFLFFVFVNSVFAKEKVALVLSGGGAKGLAHIALLEEIEKKDIQIDYVIGTSIGSLIGAFYASGLTSSDIKKIIVDEDIMSLFLPPTSPEVPFINSLNGKAKPFFTLDFESLKKIGSRTGLISDLKLMCFFNKHLFPNGYKKNFDDLDIKFRAVSYDLKTNKMVVFDKGSLVEAMRASMSIPLVFNIFKTENGNYIDGGVINNIPVSVAKSLGCDVIITNDVSASEKDYDNSFSALGVAMVSQLKSDAEIYEANNKKDSTIYIRHHLDSFGLMGFDKADEIISVGRENVAKHLDELEKMPKKSADDETANKKDSADVSEVRKISSLVIKNTLDNSKKYFYLVESFFESFVGQELKDETLLRLENKVLRLNERADFESLYFILEEESREKYSLVIKYRPKINFKNNISMLEDVSLKLYNKRDETKLSYEIFPFASLIYERLFGDNNKHTFRLSTLNHKNIFLSYDMFLSLDRKANLSLLPFAEVEAGRLMVGEESLVQSAFNDIDYKFRVGVNLFLDKKTADFSLSLMANIYRPSSLRTSWTSRHTFYEPKIELDFSLGKMTIPLIREGNLFSLKLHSSLSTSIYPDEDFDLEAQYSFNFFLLKSFELSPLVSFEFGFCTNFDRSNPELLSGYVDFSSPFVFPSMADVQVSDFYYGFVGISQKIRSGKIAYNVVSLSFFIGGSEERSNDAVKDMQNYREKRKFLQGPYAKIDKLDIAARITLGIKSNFFQILLGFDYKFITDNYTIFIHF